MEICFAPKGILQIDDARIVYRNFSGTASKFNREGDRNFAVVIPTEDLAEELSDLGWNIKVKPLREGEDVPFMFLPVKIKFNERGPIAYLKSGGNLVKLDEEGISCLDDVDIERVDLDIRPYDWDVSGKQGRTAYLQSICVTQRVDRFAERYGINVEEPDNDEPMPF